MNGYFKRSVKTFLCALSMTVLSAAVFSPARAEDYPSRPIELVVGYLAGGSTDFAARVLAEALTPILKQPVVVVNRPGATSGIAIDAVKRADPDGYTLLFGTADAIVIVPAVKPSVTYKIPEDLTFISKVADFPLVFAVSSRLGLNTMADFVAFAKANPGKFNYGSSGIGSALHIEAVRTAQAAGIDITHVAYKGSAGAATDLIAGNIDGMFGVVKDVSSYLPSGGIKLLAVTSATRDPLIADVPTLAEAGLGAATFTGWYGIIGPAKMPKDVTDKISAALAEALSKPEVKERLATAGQYVSVQGEAEFTPFVVEQFKEFKELADKQNIRVTE